MDSLRTIMSRWVVVLVSVAALVMGAVAAGTAATSASAGAARAATHPAHSSFNRSRHPKTKSAADSKAKSTVGDVDTATWMHDLAPHIRDRKLGQIVIPGSHDTASYGIPAPDDDLWHTQSDDLIHQLDDGMRQFDIRVEYKETGNTTLNQPYFHGCCDPNYYAQHGANFWLDKASVWLTLDRIFSDIETWAKEPGHDQEVLILNLAIEDENTISGHTPGDPNLWFKACQSFGQQMGDALVTPGELADAYGTTDPGQVTLGDLWSLPDPKGYARVLLYNRDCLTAANPGPAPGYWAPVGSYYADQCTANGIDVPENNQQPGIEPLVLKAAQTRATGAGGQPNGLGPPSPDGLYNLGIMGTPEIGCLYTPTQMLGDEEQVLAALYQQWQTDPATLQNLNIISGDFLQRTDLMKDVIAMDQSFVQADRIAAITPNPVHVDLQFDHNISNHFLVMATDGGAPVRGQSVKWSVSPAPDNPSRGAEGPSFDDSTTTTTTTTTGIGGDTGPTNLNAGSAAGTWELTASIPGGSQTWTIDIARSDPYQLTTAYIDGGHPNPAVPVTATLSGGLKVQVLTTGPEPSGVSGRKVTFDANGAGTFAGGATTATVESKDGPDGQGVAVSPAFTAGTHAGALPITVTTDDAASLSMPVTVSAGSPADFVRTTAKDQSTQIGSTLPAGWAAGHWVDRYGNVVENPSAPYDELKMDVDPSAAAWPNGETSIEVPPASDGTISAPALHIGQVDRGQLDGGSVAVYVGNFQGEIALVDVNPGPPHDVSVRDGDGQQTAAGQPFAKALKVKVTDAAGNPIPGTTVVFQVTSGQAAFALPSGVSARFGQTASAPAPAAGAPPSASMITDSDGIATAPTLVAGQPAGPIEVTATAGSGAAATSAVFHLSAAGPALEAPTITGVSNGDQVVQVSVSDTNSGTAPVTSYEVRATDANKPTAAPVTATGPTSPIAVSGLTNGDPYTFTVTATNMNGTSPESAPFGPLNIGVPPAFTSGPADGVVGQAYSSRFTLRGAPPPTVSLVSGDLPPGLTLGSDGALTGTPTQAGTYEFTVRAASTVGQIDDGVIVQITQSSSGPATNSVQRGACATPTRCSVRSQRPRRPHHPRHQRRPTRAARS